MRKKGRTAEEYVAFLEEMETFEEGDRAFFDSFSSAVDRALSAGDTDSLIRLQDLFSSTENRNIMARSSDLLKLRYILGAVENEHTLGFPLFTEGLSSCRELIDRYDYVNLLLRRIEFEITPFDTEALAYIRNQNISAYALSAILYNFVSRVGHREKVLLRVASDALEHGLLLNAFGCLGVIENPSPDSVALKTELTTVLQEGVS